MYDVVALGEILIDFTPSGLNELGMQLFACNPGGAPANVLAMNARLGGKTAFVGKVGKDSFGDFLGQTLTASGIDISGLRRSENFPTTLAFVHLSPGGDRSFSFYRKPGADIDLTVGEIDTRQLRSCKVFHFGSVSLSDEPVRSATLFAAETARRAGAVISYDPNYRELLWSSEKDAVREMLAALSLADIVKVSDSELLLLCGTDDLKAGAELLSSYGPGIVLITMGEKGAYYHTPTAQNHLPTYNVQPVDTTGAGDAFLGALLYSIKDYSLEQLKGLSGEYWDNIISFSNAAGSLTTTQKGAIPAMPDIAAIEQCIREGKLCTV